MCSNVSLKRNMAAPSIKYFGGIEQDIVWMLLLVPQLGELSNIGTNTACLYDFIVVQCNCVRCFTLLSCQQMKLEASRLSSFSISHLLAQKGKQTRSQIWSGPHSSQYSLSITESLYEILSNEYML